MASNGYTTYTSGRVSLSLKAIDTVEQSLAVETVISNVGERSLYGWLICEQERGFVREQEAERCR